MFTRKLAPGLVLKYYRFRIFLTLSRGHVRLADFRPLAAEPVMKKKAKNQ